VSIRLRLATVFTIAAAVLFSFGGWLFASALSSALLATVDSQLGSVLARAATYAPTSSTSATKPSSTAGSAPAKLPPGEFFVQIIDSSGVVRGASPDAGSRPLLGAMELARARTQRVTTTSTVEGERTRLVAAPFPGHAGWVGVAAVSLDTYDATLSDVFRELLIGGLAFVAVAGLGAYGIARGALSPVERLRREVAALSERDDDAGVGVPGTKDELAALAVTMNALLSRLHGALARERRFVADASHELRTPFAVLRGELELAGRPGRSREELQRAVTSAAEEAGRLNRLTDDLLLLARSDSDQLALRPEPTNLALLLGRSAELARRRAESVGVTCRVELAPGTLVRVDPDRIRQAVDNLVDNALHFAPRGTQVLIRACVAGDGHGVTIEVADSGPGFPPDFLPHAFERFRRPDSGRARRDGGAGLGLAIVSAVSLAHGGRAVARNRPEGGAVVSIELPTALV